MNTDEKGSVTGRLASTGPNMQHLTPSSPEGRAIAAACRRAKLGLELETSDGFDYGWRSNPPEAAPIFLNEKPTKEAKR